MLQSSRTIKLISLFSFLSILFLFTGCEDDEKVHFVDKNYDMADIVDGGKLYDKWWKVNSGTEPTTDFSPWAAQSTNSRSGGDTWRCKECHGWDYVGDEGRYASGSHYTGFEGVSHAEDHEAHEIFDAIKDEGGTHDLSAVLSDDDILNLTKFIMEGLVDMSAYMTDGVATGDAANGKTLYDANCTSCHGADGNTLDFKSSSDGIQGVYWLSNDNPQETLHKIRWGHPGSAMPSMVDKGLSADDCGDILAYAQTMHFDGADFSLADIVAGGKLYDKWWKVNSGTEPTTDFSPWAAQSTNSRSGGDTWRCKECHGWDYIGKDGRYASGSHFTGFEGVMDASAMEPNVIFEAIKDEGGTHDLSAVLSDEDVVNLTMFIVDGLVDMSAYMTDGVATGDAANGKTLYDTNCASCHGADGNTLDFKSSEGDQGVNWLSNDNPQETLHKIRWGHPGSAMPSMVDAGLSADDCGDILAYAQVMDYHAADYSIADIVKGGKLYDKWWKVNSGTEPTTDFSPWAAQSTNSRSGGDTWRCKECHGWDYIGKDGRYASGSHFTGFAGVMDASLKDPIDIFYAIKDKDGDHDLSAVLSDGDVVNLTKFIVDGLVDMSAYMTDGVATGDVTNGKTLYDANCASCHGTDGNTLDFKSSTEGIQGIGWLSDDNPQETLHKIRWGHPGTAMPSMVDTGLSDDDCGDILAYGQSLE